jgi:hypothetical protein
MKQYSKYIGAVALFASLAIFATLQISKLNNSI